MCECGCGAFNAEYKLPGPDGTLYVLQVNPPCPDCATPLGIVVHRFTPAEAAEWRAGELPELAPNAVGIGISLLDSDELRKSLPDVIDAPVDEDDIGNLAPALVIAVRETRRAAKGRGAW